MTPEIPPVKNEQSIKTFDGLKEKDQKITPQILEELKTLLKQKYGVDLDKAIFNITKEELDQLKTELNGNVNPKTVLEKFLYDEYLETKIENEGFGAVSIDTVTSGIDSNRLNEMKTKFEEVINPILDKYEFFDKNTKNVIKLALANKLISSESGEQTLGVLNDFKEVIENPSVDGLASLADDTKKKETKDGVKSGFEKILTSYVEGFEKIQTKLNNFEPKLTSEQKQNIIGNMDYFRNPEKIEASFDEKIINEIKLENKDKKVVNNLTIDEQEKLKKYMKASRSQIENLASKFEGGEKILEIGLNLMSNEGFLGETTKSIIETLLKIPFLGEILAMFLGLDSKNPIDDLNKQTELFKVLKSFKSLGVQKDKNGKKTESGKLVFKDIDLSEIKYSDIKTELKQIKEISQDKDMDKFWEESFGNGFEKDGVKLKFEITDEQKKDNKIESKEFKEFIKNGFDKFNEEKAKKEQETQIKQREDKIKENQTQLNTIGTKNNALKLLGGNTIEGLKDTNGIGDYHDFKKIKLSEIKDSQEGQLDDILKKTIGEGWKVWEVSHTSDYEKLSPKIIEALKQSVVLIQEFLKTDAGKNIDGKISIGDLIEKKEFKEFITNKSKELDGNKKELETFKGRTQLAEEIGKKIGSIKSETKLSKGIEIGDLNNKKIIKFEEGKLSIGEEKFKISGITATLNDIVIDNTDKIKFKGTLGIIPGKEEVDKSIFINGIQELVINGKFEFTNGDKKITIDKA